ncbi:MAG TPA: AEC family transporter [Methanocella sp.]|uniref:AEC family transporter n=1 Tax=Methanocella sp. TaxID=2052833 RepID=UPI002BB5AED3|nr:AEC family transporter [Methanocella sp.]HTY92239.1 AEC family transporter [Methanocella sp.]
MTSVLSVLIPIFGLILLGWFLKWLHLLNDWLVRLINDYVYYIGISVITFVSLHDTSTSILLDPGIYILNIVPMLLVIIVAYAVVKMLKLPKEMSAIFVICAFYGNTGYIGFPLNVIVQGQGALNMAAFISTLYTVVVFTLGIYLLKRNSDEPVEAGKLHKLPVIWAALLGILLSWLTLPGFVRLPLELISDSTSPLALLATGAMAEGAALKMDMKNIGILSAIKLILAPALVAIMGTLMGSTGVIYKTSLLEAATPVAVTNSVLASQFKMKEEFASHAVIISTALFAITLTIILLFF